MPRRTLTRTLAWLAFALCAAALSCSRSGHGERAEQRLVVFAAASLREAFTSLAQAFEQRHPRVKVSFNFAGTQELRTQLEHGAEVDVFASADQRHMAELVKARRVKGSRVFARNEPVIVVSRASSAAIADLGDLPNATRLVIGTPDAPIGRYTLRILENAGARFGRDFSDKVSAKVVSRELNVRQVLAKVTLGEADAGIVYRTDVRSGDATVSVVSIPEPLNVLAEYPIALVSGAPRPELAKAWIELVLSAEGQRALGERGFLGAE